MTKSSRNMHFSFSKFRRNPSATDRRLCMMWINKMVNKQVEKRISELHRELFLMNQALREEMVTALQEQLRELLVEEPGERPLHCSKLDRVPRLASRRQREVEEEYKNTDGDEEDAEESPSRKTLTFPEPHSDTYSIFIVRKGQKEECLRISLSSDSSDTDSSDVQTNTEPATGRQQKNQSCSPDVTPACDTSRSMEEGDRTRNPFHAKPSFMSNAISREDEEVHVDNDEEPLLMARESNEWVDKQEMTGNRHKKKPVESQENTEKPGASGVSEKHNQQNMSRGDTVKKIKTYISDVFSFHSSHKWKKFENED